MSFHKTVPRYYLLTGTNLTTRHNCTNQGLWRWADPASTAAFLTAIIALIVGVGSGGRCAGVEPNFLHNMFRNSVRNLIAYAIDREVTCWTRNLGGLIWICYCTALSERVEGAARQTFGCPCRTAIPDTSFASINIMGWAGSGTGHCILTGTSDRSWTRRAWNFAEELRFKGSAVQILTAGHIKSPVIGGG